MLEKVSGGIVDTTGHEDQFPFYRYGGIWKNKHEKVSVKKKNSKSGKKGKSGAAEKAIAGVEPVAEGAGRAWKETVEYIGNDRVRSSQDGISWLCRRSHWSEERNGPNDEKRVQILEDGGIRMNRLEARKPVLTLKLARVMVFI